MTKQIEDRTGVYKHLPKTIDLTPTWAAAASIYIEVLQNPEASEEGKKIAREEILRMAGLATRLQELSQC